LEDGIFGFHLWHTSNFAPAAIVATSRRTWQPNRWARLVDTIGAS